MKAPALLLTLPQAGKRRTDPALSWVIWSVAAAFLFGLALLKTHILPAYFFFDAGTIESYIESGARLSHGDSYASTAAVFGAFGLRRDSLWLPVVSGLVVIATLLGGIAAASRGRMLRPTELLISGFFCALAVVYMTTLSKDLIVLAVTLAFVLLPTRRRWLWLTAWSLLALLYGYYFRAYWFFVVPVFFMLRAACISRRPVLVGPVALLCLLLIALAFDAVLGVGVDAYRALVNDVRLEVGDPSARTMITSFIGGHGLVTSYINVCLTLASLIFPIPLFSTLSPYYVAIALFVAALHVNFWRSFFGVVREGSNVGAIDCGCLVAAFVTIQSVFEPDYGSYVRHLSPFYLCMFRVWFDARNRYVTCPDMLGRDTGAPAR